LKVDAIMTRGDVEAIVAMAKNHPAPEYDCTFEHFAEVLRKIAFAPNVRGWVLKDGDKYAGYTIGILSKDLTFQINVFDIYLEPEYRGHKNILYLTNRLKEWAEAEEVLRVMWTSRWPIGAWSNLLGLKIGQYNTYVWEV
jgi:hypothetical protein